MITDQKDIEKIARAWLESAEHCLSEEDPCPLSAAWAAGQAMAWCDQLDHSNDETKYSTYSLKFACAKVMAKARNIVYIGSTQQKGK